MYWILFIIYSFLFYLIFKKIDSEMPQPIESSMEKWY